MMSSSSAPLRSSDSLNLFGAKPRPSATPLTTTRSDNKCVVRNPVPNLPVVVGRPVLSFVRSFDETCSIRNLMFSADLSGANQLKKNGGTGYAKTVTVWAPKLREAGVKDETLHQILVDNPRRFLAFVPKKKRPA